MVNGEAPAAEGSESQIGLRRALTAAEEAPEKAPVTAGGVAEVEEIEGIPTASAAAEPERFDMFFTPLTDAINGCEHSRCVGVMMLLVTTDTGCQNLLL